MNHFTLLFLLATLSLNAQSVSTYFSSSSVDIDDGMVFDTDGNLYGSNFDGNAVYKITPTGEASVFAAGLANPNGLAFDSNQNLYVVEYSGASIHKYDSSGNLVESFSVGSFPSGLIKDFDSDDMIFTLTSNHSINRLATDGTITEIFQGAPLSAPVGLAYDESGVLLIGNFTGRKIHKWQADSLSYIATVPDDGAVNNKALGFIAYGDGAIWGTSFGGHRIYKVNPTAVNDVVLFAGNTAGNLDGPVAEATFNAPNGIIFNAAESALYISEFSGVGDIRKIDLLPVAVNEAEFPNVNINLYPNPVVNQLSIKGDFDKTQFNSLTVSIMDNLGRKIYEKYDPVSTGYLNSAIDVSQWSAGNYSIQFLDENGFVFSKPFVIVR